MSAYSTSLQAFSGELVGGQHFPKGGKTVPPSQEWPVPQTANVVAGFTKLDLGHDELNAIVAVNSGDDYIGASVAGLKGSNMCGATARVMGFLPSDDRIQTGVYNLDYGSEVGGEQKSELWRRIKFARAFKAPPSIALFISKVEFFEGFLGGPSWARVSVGTDENEMNTFALSLRAWERTAVEDIGVYYVAHEFDDKTIRSGTFASGRNDGNAMSLSGRHTFQFELPDTPRALMYGFSHIDARGDDNLRISVTTSNLDRYGFDYRFSTWLEKSIFFELRCSYVAVL